MQRASAVATRMFPRIRSHSVSCSRKQQSAQSDMQSSTAERARKKSRNTHRFGKKTRLVRYKA